MLARPSEFLHSQTVQQTDHQLPSSFLVQPPGQFQMKSSLFCFSDSASFLTRSQSFGFFHLSVRLIRSKPQLSTLALSWCCHFTFRVCTSSNLQTHTSARCSGDRQCCYLHSALQADGKTPSPDLPFLLPALDYAPCTVSQSTRSQSSDIFLKPRVKSFSTRVWSFVLLRVTVLVEISTEEAWITVFMISWFSK